MLADQPYLEETTTQGVVERRLESFTLSISAAGSSAFHQLVSPLNLDLSALAACLSSSSSSPSLRSSFCAFWNLWSSNSVSDYMRYSSMGSVK